MYYYFIFIHDTLITFAFKATKFSIEPFSINKSYHYLDIKKRKTAATTRTEACSCSKVLHSSNVRAEGLLSVKSGDGAGKPQTTRIQDQLIALSVCLHVSWIAKYNALRCQAAESELK